MSRPLTALFLFLLLPAMLHAQQPGVIASAKAESTEVKLSEPVRLTLTIEGPAPMRGAVQLPEPLLTADANGSWRIRTDGEVEVTPLPNGREQWKRVYRLDPFVPKELLGKPLRVTFNPVTVNGQPVTWPAVDVTVKRKGAADAPLPEPHAVTAVEDLPPPSSTHSRVWWPVLAGAFVFACACAVPFVVVLLRKRRAKPVPPGEWARATLAKLNASGANGAVIAERVAAILRRFVERRFAIPATKFTTTELSAATTEQGWPVEEAESLRALLDECDLAKFAGDSPDDDRSRRLISAAGDWVDNLSRPHGPG